MRATNETATRAPATRAVAMTGKGVTFPASLAAWQRRAHLLYMDVRMPWVQEALERPCAWVALDRVRFMLRGRPAAFPTQLGTSYIPVSRAQHDEKLV